MKWKFSISYQITKKREHIIATNGYCIEINKGIMILNMYKRKVK